MNAATIFGAAADLVGGAINNINAREREEAARQQNFTYGEMAADNADIRTRKLYADLYSPAARMQQIKDAGLSPSLFAEGAGIGGDGHAGAQGNGSGNVTPSIFGVDPLKAAQIELMQAQARKTSAEADTESGTNVRGEAEIKQILTDVAGKEASTEYTKMQTAHEDILRYIDEKSAEDKLHLIHFTAEQMRHAAERTSYEVISALAKANVDKNTVEEQIKKIKLENDNLYFNKLLTQSHIELNDAEKDKIANECAKWQEELLQEWYKLNLEQFNAETQRGQAITYNEYIRNLHEFQSRQVSNLEERLEFDKKKLDREMKFKYIELVSILLDHGMERGANMLTSILKVVSVK